MSSSLYRPSRPETNPFQIYGAGHAGALPETPYRPQAFPGELPRRRRPAATAPKVATSTRFVAPPQWQPQPHKATSKSVWVAIAALLVALFGLMLAPGIMEWQSTQAFRAEDTARLLNPPSVPVLSPVASVSSPRTAQVKTRTVRVVTRTPSKTPWSVPSSRPSATIFSWAPLMEGVLTSPFGQRWHHRHQGVDLAARWGTPVYAVSQGRVTFSGWMSGYGKSVLVDHGRGYKTRYAHCSKLLVVRGQNVAAGQVIARVGSTGHSTGPHLHFEVLINGLRRNPARYFRLTAPFIPWGSKKPALLASTAHEKPQAQESMGDSLMSLWRQAHL